MRKSSLSNRKSNIPLTSERRSRGLSIDGHRSSLLQPGFASKHRRSSSADRDSGVGLLSRKSHLPIRRSRSQLTVTSSVTPRRETISPCSSRNTPVDGSKYSSRALGTSQKPRKDVRNFTNKSVYSAAVAQITNFFSQRGKTLSFRQPLTLKTFLDVTMFLLDEVGVPANLTSANYVEEIPYLMRILNYPGSLAGSWLKTAYAQHSLVHVIALLSWLVDLIESISTTSTTSYFEESDNDGFRILPAQDYFEMFACAHFKWNHFQSEDEIIEEFKDKLAQAFMPDFDESSKDALESEIKALFAKCQPENEIISQKNEIEETLKHLNSDISNLQMHLKNTKKFCATLDSKIQTLDTKKEETEGKIVSTQCLTEKLRKQVASQEMTMEDLNEVIQTCEHLRGRIRSGEKCVSDLLDMAFKLDRQIVQTRAKFNEKMEHFNNLLVMESCSIPVLSDLQIESNVLAVNYKDETEEVDKTLSSLHKDLYAKRSKANEELTTLQALLAENNHRNNIISLDITNLVEKIRQVEDRIQSVKARMLETETKLREEEKHLHDEIGKNLNSQDIADLKQRLAVLTARQENWEVETKKMMAMAEKYFKDRTAILASSVREAQNVRAQKLDRLKKMIELKEAQRSKRK